MSLFFYYTRLQENAQEFIHWLKLHHDSRSQLLFQMECSLMISALKRIFFKMHYCDLRKELNVIIFTNFSSGGSIFYSFPKVIKVVLE